MKAELMFLIDRFPSHKEKFISLFDESKEFQALCHEYFRCAQFLNQWKAVIDQHRKRLREYNRLKTALEKELLRFFANKKFDN